MLIILVSVLAFGLVGELPVHRDTIRLAPGAVERLGVKVEPALAASHPGSVVATLELPPDPALVEVPESSRLHSEGRDWVFVQPEPDTPTFRLRPVRVERMTPGVLTTRNDPEEGLKPGDRVVVAGVLALKAALDAPEARAESRR